MTVLDITNAALVTFRLRQTLDNEDWQFGCKTIIRDPADQIDLLTAALGWITSGDLIMERTALTAITYSEWSTSGFTGFHQLQAVLASDTFSSGNQLPPQCAVVVSLLNTTETSLSIKRRRGRIYWGQIPVANVDGDGQLSTSSRNDYGTAVESLDAALRSVPSGALSGSDLDGLCVCSPAAGEIMQADFYGVGLAVDTQRRRRRKRTESISYQPLP